MCVCMCMPAFFCTIFYHECTTTHFGSVFDFFLPHILYTKPLLLDMEEMFVSNTSLPGYIFCFFFKLKLHLSPSHTHSVCSRGSYSVTASQFYICHATNNRLDLHVDTGMSPPAGKEMYTILTLVPPTVNDCYSLCCPT